MAQAGLVAAPDTLEQDVRAVLTKVELGEVDAALVYASDARSAGDTVTVIDVPNAASVVTRYPIAVLSGADNSAAARQWIEVVLGRSGRTRSPRPDSDPHERAAADPPRAGRGGRRSGVSRASARCARDPGALD